MLRSRGDRAAISRVLVLQLLTYLEQVGLVLEMSGDARFGVATAPHHHAICVGCGAVTEVSPEAAAKATGELERVTGVRVGGSG